VLFSRASEAHFVELDQQLLDGKLIGLRGPCRMCNRA
jgi:two-component system heavy metal sensor histidine kinase CusS